jgi:hypothetical protein
MQRLRASESGFAANLVNEYRITLSEHGIETTCIVESETAAGARQQIENDADADVIAVKFVRALSFSCRMRTGGTLR